MLNSPLMRLRFSAAHITKALGMRGCRSPPRGSEASPASFRSLFTVEARRGGGFCHNMELEAAPGTTNEDELFAADGGFGISVAVGCERATGDVCTSLEAGTISGKTLHTSAASMALSAVSTAAKPVTSDVAPGDTELKSSVTCVHASVLEEYSEGTGNHIKGSLRSPRGCAFNLDVSVSASSVRDFDGCDEEDPRSSGGTEDLNGDTGDVQCKGACGVGIRRDGKSGGPGSLADDAAAHECTLPTARLGEKSGSSHAGRRCGIANIFQLIGIGGASPLRNFLGDGSPSMLLGDGSP